MSQGGRPPPCLKRTSTKAQPGAFGHRRLTDQRGSDDGDFYVSDEENAVGNFAHLNVIITRVGFQRTGGNGAESDSADATEDENGRTPRMWK